MIDIKKPRVCAWISEESWDSLNLKEKDYIIFLHSKKYSKKQIMRKLHICDDSSYWRIQKKVRKILKDDIVKRNEYIWKILKNAKSD